MCAISARSGPRPHAGEGGDLILSQATEVLRPSSPKLPSAFAITSPTKKRSHGQAIAAAAFRRFLFRRPTDAIHKPTADFFVPDGTALAAALARTTHLCLAAHQDDIEIMAYHGIAECWPKRQVVQWRRRLTAPAAPRRHLRRLHR